ncbi:MAG: glycosyltransferase [Rhodobacteraceae bacterium]|nr:glycosyltransferase [Paracoccaceae bacterium]
MHVTIVIPTFNRAALLAGGIEAALAQTHCDLSVLVLDDGSTDRTAERLAAFRNNPRVAWVRLARSSGAAAAKNLGLLLARGEAVGFHACDDIPARAKIAAQLEALARYRRAAAPALDGRAIRPEPAADLRPDVVLTGHVAIGCDGSEEVVDRPDWIEDRSADARLDAAAPARRPLVDAGLFRREVFRRLGGFAKGVDEDRDMRARIRAAGGVVGFVPHPLLTRFERSSLRSVDMAPDERGARPVGDAAAADPPRTTPRQPVVLGTLAVAEVHSHRPLRIDPAVPVRGFHPSLARFGLVDERAPAAAGA